MQPQGTLTHVPPVRRHKGRDRGGGEGRDLGAGGGAAGPRALPSPSLREGRACAVRQVSEDVAGLPSWT